MSVELSRAWKSKSIMLSGAGDVRYCYSEVFMVGHDSRPKVLRLQLHIDSSLTESSDL